MNNNEDYLDGLLDNVTKRLSEFDEDFEQTKQAADPYLTKKNLPPKTMKALASVKENQFLRDFEDELNKEDTDRFLAEFETELGDDARGFERPISARGRAADNAPDSAFDDDLTFDEMNLFSEDTPSEPQFSDTDVMTDMELFAGLDTAPASEPSFDLNTGNDTAAAGMTGLDDLGDLSGLDTLSDMDLFGGQMETDSDAFGAADNNPAADDGMSAFELDTSLDAMAPLPEGMEALGDLFGDSGLAADDEEKILPEDDESVMNDDDILKMLGESSDDEALSDIGKMLEADEQSISLDDLNAEPENLAYAAGAVKKQKAGAREPKQKKNGFFAKLMDLLFGEDEDDEAQLTPEQVAELNSLDGISDENLEILRAMNGDKLSEPEDKGKKKKKKEKKPKKEKKAKEPKPKKEKKSKEKKPKKERKPKDPVPREKPLPRGPVVMIWLMALSVLAFILIGNQLLSKNNSVSAAELSFDKGDYVSSYAELVGVKVSGSDEELYERARVLAGVQTELNAYYSMMEARKFDLALDCLVRTIGRAELHAASAEEWGVTAQLEAIEAEAEQHLQDQFDVSKKQAKKLYAIDDRDEYSLALDEILQKLGLK